MKISVIVPAYNEEKMIGKCIKALKNQTISKRDYEIIVVDNGSTDDTAKIAKQDGVKVISFIKKNIVAAVRNFGASEANGEIVAFVDSDSVASDDWLESIIKLLGNEKIVGVGGFTYPLNGNFILRFLFRFYNQILRLNEICGYVLPCGYNLAVRKSAFDQIGGFNENLNSFEDADIGLRIQKYFGKRSIFLSSKLKVYTSTRKQQNISHLIRYVFDVVKDYSNVVILKKTETEKIRYVR